MAGTTAGGKKSAKAVKKKFGKDAHANFGKLRGDSNRNDFAADRKRASEAGKKGAAKRWGKKAG